MGLRPRLAAAARDRGLRRLHPGARPAERRGPRRRRRAGDRAPPPRARRCGRTPRSTAAARPSTLRRPPASCSAASAPCARPTAIRCSIAPPTAAAPRSRSRRSRAVTTSRSRSRGQVRDELLFARIEGLEPSGLGRLRTALYKDVRRLIGLDDRVYRLVGANAADGLYSSPRPPRLRLPRPVRARAKSGNNHAR